MAAAIPEAAFAFSSGSGVKKMHLEATFYQNKIWMSLPKEVDVWTSFKMRIRIRTTFSEPVFITNVESSSRLRFYNVEMLYLKSRETFGVMAPPHMIDIVVQGEHLRGDLTITYMDNISDTADTTAGDTYRTFASLEFI